uniref:C2 domain-containing protein n=1 Tax=Schistosoma mansoni TaxID=6183 RepID=A0A5K4FF20_SCHMA
MTSFLSRKYFCFLGRSSQISDHPNQRNLVQVYTVLPPGIDSKVTAHLILIVRLFRPNSSFTGSRRLEFGSNSLNDIYVQVRWWGEPAGEKCAIFYPRLAHKVGHKQATCTKARYRITVPLDRFSAYLKDMRELRLDVIDIRHQRIIGRGRLDRVDRLTPTTPIDAILPVINELGEKLGDLNISLMIEPVINTNSKSMIDSIQSQQNNGVVNEHPVDLDIGSLDQDNYHSSHNVNLLDNSNNYRLRTTIHGHGRELTNTDKDSFSTHSGNNNDVNFSKREQLLSLALEKSKHLREALSCSSIFNHQDYNDNESDDKNNMDGLRASRSYTSDGRFSGGLTPNKLHHSSPDLRSIMFEECIHNHDNRIHLASQTKTKSNNFDLIKYILDNESLDDPVQVNTQNHDNHHRQHHVSYKKGVHLQNIMFANGNDSNLHADKGIGVTQDYPLSNNNMVVQFGNSEYIKEDDELIENLLYSNENSIDENELLNSNTLFKQSNNVQPLKQDTLNGKIVNQHYLSKSGCNLKGANLHFKCLSLCRKYAENKMSNVVNSSKSTLYNKTSRNPTKLLSQKSHPISVSSVLPFNKVKSNDINTLSDSIFMELEVSVPTLSSLSSSNKIGGTWTTTSFTLSTELRNQFEVKSTKRKQQNDDAYVNFYCLTNKKINNSNDAYIQVNFNHQLHSNDKVNNHDNHIRLRLFRLSNPVKEDEDTTQWESELIGVNFVNPDEIRSIILSKVHLNSSNLTTHLYIHLCSGQKMKTKNSNVIGRLELELEPIWNTIATSRNQMNINILKKDNESFGSIQKSMKNDKFHSVQNSMYHKPDLTKELVPSNTVILNTILHISEGKELKLSNNYRNKQLLTSKYITKLPNDCIVIEHSYLIVRLPWCHQIHSSSDLSTINLDQYHSNVAWLSGSCPQYAFTIRSQCLLNQHPMIPVDTWLPIIDPFSGCENGQIHVLLAVGTQEQIDNLLTLQNLKCTIDADNNTITNTADQGRKSGIIECKEITRDNSCVDLTVEHRIGITFEQLFDFDPRIPLQYDSNYNGAVPWGDLDCYVQYFFPTDTKAKCLASTRTTTQMLNKPSMITNHTIQEQIAKHISCEFISANSLSKKENASSSTIKSPPSSSSSYWSHTHRLCTNIQITSESQNKMDLIRSKIETEFIQWILDMLTRADFESNKLNLKRGLLIELWLRIYSPNLHDCLAAKGYIPEELLCKLISKNKSLKSGDDEEDDRNDEHNHQSIRFFIDLYDVNSSSGCLNGRLQISMDYCYNIINRSSTKFDNTLTKSITAQPTTLFNKQSILISTSSNQPIHNSILILPSQTQFNHHIQICLNGISGMKFSIMKHPNEISYTNRIFHARLHCLLLIPNDKRYSHSPMDELYHIHLIKSTISSPIYNTHYTMELNCKLDIQLPTSWLIAYQQYNNQSNLINNQNRNNYEITLLEAILNGDQYQMEQYRRPIIKPCLQYTNFEQQSNENINSIINPGKEYQLISSCRVPLSALIFSSHGNLPSRWYPLTSFINVDDDIGKYGDDNSLISWQSKFSGAIQLSMRLTDPHLIKIVPCNNLTTTIDNNNNNAMNNIHSPSIINCLRDWNILFNVEKLENGQNSIVAFKNEFELWKDGLDEYGCQYKHFTIYLNFAYLPKIKQLLNDTIDFNNPLPRNYTIENNFKAYTFVRFQFPNYGTQMSQLIFLPNDDDHTSDRQSTIVEFKEYKEFVIPVSAELRNFLAESTLEFQVWIIWTDENLKELDKSNNNYETGLQKFIIDELNNKEYPKRHQVPAPRHIGTATIPLYHLLYPRPQVTSHSNTNSINCLEGDPSGIRWWNNQQQWMGTDRINSSGLAVYPLYRANTANFYDSWIAVHIEMTGSKTENCLWSKRYHTCKMNKLILPEIDGHLGWNLKHYKVPSLVNNPLYNSNNNCHLTTEFYDDNYKKNETFPAEIIVEKAYHLRLSHHNKFDNSTESSENSEPYFKTNDDDDDDDDNNNNKETADYSVFVTFPVNGGNHYCFNNKHSITGNTNQNEKLWKQITKLSNINSNRIALTPKVKNLEYAHWNYCRFVRIPLELIQPSCNQGLMFHVWAMKHDDDDYDLNNDSSYTPKLIGIATVDLTTLSHLFSDPIHSTNNEFNQIYGWYHVLNNDTGCPSGQILIGVKPLINIGQQHLTNYYSSSLNNNEFTTNNNFSSLSHNVYTDQIKPFGNYSIFQYGLNSTLSNCDLAKSTHSLNDCNTGKVSDDILVNKEESNHSELNRSVLFENLRTRLNELDEINTKLKNRLNLSTSNEKFFSHADNNTTDIDKNYNDDTNMKNESFFNQSSQNKLQSLNEEIDYSTLVNDLSLSQHQPHYSQHLADLHANDENMLYVNSKFQCTVLQSQLNHDSDDNTYFTHKINDDFTINKFINQCNHHFTIDDCSFTNSTNENIDCLISNSLKQSTENGRLNTMEKDNDNNNIDVESALTNDGDNDDDAHNKENIVNTDKDDEQSEISVVSPLLHDQSSNISDAHDYNDDEDIISIGTDIQHITSCNEISREGGGSYDTDCNNDEKKLEEDNVKQLHNNNNDSRSSNKIVHNESEQYSPMNNKLSHTEINNVLTELLNQKSLSETSASSVWLPDDDDDNVDNSSNNGILYENDPSSLYTRSTITQSPPSIDNQSIRQVEVSLTNSQNIQMNKPIISHEHELTQNRIIQNKVYESNEEKMDRNRDNEEEQRDKAKILRLDNDDDDDNSAGYSDKLKLLNKDDDLAETSRWDTEQPLSVNSKLTPMFIPNFFPSTSRIEELFTSRTNDCQEDSNSMDSNTNLSNNNKNIDPLRNRLNNRLSEAVLYTMNTTMTDSNPQTNNNANLIINDTLSAFITNGYKTRSLKKAERVFNMTFK